MAADAVSATTPPHPEETAAAPTGSAPLTFLAFAVICGAIALYEWWDLVGAGSVGMAAGAAIIHFARRRRRRGVASLGWILAIASLAGTALVLVLCVWLRIGYVRRNDWPRPLEEMIEAAHADPSTVRIQCLGNFIDSAYVWKLDVAATEVDAVAAQFNLFRREASEVPSWFKSGFPIWWRPRPTINATYLSTEEFPRDGRGPDGDHYLAVYDPDRESLYVLMLDNF